MKKVEYRQWDQLILQQMSHQIQKTKEKIREEKLKKSNINLTILNSVRPTQFGLRSYDVIFVVTKKATVKTIGKGEKSQNSFQIGRRQSAATTEQTYDSSDSSETTETSDSDSSDSDSDSSSQEL